MIVKTGIDRLFFGLKTFYFYTFYTYFIKMTSAHLQVLGLSVLGVVLILAVASYAAEGDKKKGPKVTDKVNISCISIT